MRSRVDFCGWREYAATYAGSLRGDHDSYSRRMFMMFRSGLIITVHDSTEAISAFAKYHARGYHLPNHHHQVQQPRPPWSVRAPTSPGDSHRTSRRTIRNRHQLARPQQGSDAPPAGDQMAFEGHQMVFTGHQMAPTSDATLATSDAPASQSDGTLVDGAPRHLTPRERLSAGACPGGRGRRGRWCT